MTVIGIGIVSKTGRVLLSRHYVDVTRIRIEGLLSAFPKLLQGNITKGHCTYIESGTVRYLYQPLEEASLVIVTTRSSNIVEDLTLLRTVGRLIAEKIPLANEAAIAERAFDTLALLDEVVVAGEREGSSAEQISTYLAMNSHEEIVAKERRQQQIADAKEIARNRAHELSRQKRGGGMMEGYGGQAQSDPLPEPPSDISRFTPVAEEPAAPIRTAVAGAMQLGRQRKGDAAVKAVVEAGGTVATPSVPAVQSAQQAQRASTAGVTIKIDEHIIAALNRDGGITSFDVRGDLFITVTDASQASIKILLSRYVEDFTYKTHPYINKPTFVSDRVLQIKDGKPYPTHQALGILRWRLQAPTPTVKPPITVNCWPSGTSASVEFELENTQLCLNNVAIVIPVPAGVEVGDMTCGTVTGGGGVVRWEVPVVNAANGSGSLDLSAPPNSTHNYFPIRVEFSSPVSLAGIVVTDVVSAESGVAVAFSPETTLIADDYTVN